MNKKIVYTLYANNGVQSCQIFETMMEAMDKASEMNAIVGYQMWHVKQVMRYIW